MASPTERVDFFFDPVCPWAWVTSRFTAEVAGLRGIDVEWRFISLRMVNEQKDYGKDFPPGLRERARGPVGRCCGWPRPPASTAATRPWGASTPSSARACTTRAAASPSCGKATSPSSPSRSSPPACRAELEAAGKDEAHDAVIRAETDLALGRTGSGVGTPILTFDPGTPAEASFFGPVLGRIPRGDEALQHLGRGGHCWPARRDLYELKRTNRQRPDFS